MGVLAHCEDKPKDYFLRIKLLIKLFKNCIDIMGDYIEINKNLYFASFIVRSRIFERRDFIKFLSRIKKNNLKHTNNQAYIVSAKETI